MNTVDRFNRLFCHYGIRRSIDFWGGGKQHGALNLLDDLAALGTQGGGRIDTALAEASMGMRRTWPNPVGKRLTLHEQHAGLEQSPTPPYYWLGAEADRVQ